MNFNGIELADKKVSAIKRHLPNLNDDGKDGLSQKIIKFISYIAQDASKNTAFS